MPILTLVRAALCTATVAATSSAALASPAEPCMPPTARHPYGNYMVPGVRGDVVYAIRDGQALALDAYVQPDERPHPAVVVVHGGGFTSGSRNAHIGQVLELLTSAGYQWFAIDYRLAGAARAQGAADDVRAALQFVRCNAGSLKVDTERIALLGEDAGAVLAAHASDAGRVRAVVLMGGLFEAGTKLRIAQPSYVLHGGGDDEVALPVAKALCDELNATGGRCTLDVVAGASHRIENWWPSQLGYKPRLVSWLRRELGPGGRGTPFTRRTLAGRLDPGLHKRVVYGPRSNLTFDAWIPPGEGPHIPVLLAHGGGWEAGDRVTYISPLFRPLAEAGFAWFSIDYRLTPEVRHPEQIQDLRDAIAFVRAHASDLRIDPRKLVIVGESASGQMAAHVGTRDHALAGVIAFYGVHDLMPSSPEVTPRSLPARLFGASSLDDRTRALIEEYSPIRHVTSGQPPMLLIHGTAEPLWEQGQRMERALSRAGAPHELFAVDGAPHGMENWEGHPEWQRYKIRVVEWIRSVSAAPR